VQKQYSVNRLETKRYDNVKATEHIYRYREAEAACDLMLVQLSVRCRTFLKLKGNYGM